MTRKELAIANLVPAEINGYELATASAAARARAEIEAAATMAIHRPRDIMQSRAEILNACRRTRFAEAALYAKPVGGGRKIIDLSIRFAEMAILAMGNLRPTQRVVYDDDEKRIIEICVTDLEKNVTFGREITISKTVERKSLKDGQKAISERLNSYGDVVFLVRATDDDLNTKQEAQASKALRTLALRLVPADIKEEARDVIEDALATRDATDPEAEKKRILDKFAGLGVMPSMLKDAGFEVGPTLTPAALQELRETYSAIRDGESNWATIVESRMGSRKEPEVGNLDEAFTAGDPADHRGHDETQAPKASQAEHLQDAVESGDPPESFGNGMYGDSGDELLDAKGKEALRRRIFKVAEAAEMTVGTWLRENGFPGMTKLTTSDLEPISKALNAAQA